MRTSSRLAVWTLVVSPLLTACGDDEVAAKARGEERPQNLCLVTIDTLRRDHVGCYGYFRDTTPELDALAEESLVFDDVQVHVAQTLPSHVSLFTGLSPREHGIESNLGRQEVVHTLPPKVRTLASTLAEQGYRTAGFVSAVPLARGTGIACGFETWVEPELQTTADVTTDAALEWLEEAPREPWFLWLHLYDPHYPYRAPKEFDRFGGDEAQRDYLAQRGIPEVYRGAKGREFQVREMQDGYDGEVLFADHHLGRLLDRLRGSALWDRTVVLVTSDHGEGLFQHGVRDHSTIWNEQLEVPLVLRVPGVAPRRVDQRLVGRDILPTLLGMLPGVDASELVAQSSGLDVFAPGYSTRPRFTIVPPKPDGAERSERPPAYLHAIEHEGWRLVVREDGVAQLYHVSVDPHELDDLAATEPARVTALSALLERVNAKELARREALGAGEGLPMDRNRLEALRALGYGGDDDDQRGAPSER